MAKALAPGTDRGPLPLDSAFDGAGRYAGDELALDEEEEDDHWQREQHGSCHLTAEVCPSNRVGERRQPDWQGIHGLVFHEGVCHEVVVPRRDESENARCDDPRDDEWKQDAPQAVSYTHLR